MYISDEVVGFGDDHGARLQRLASCYCLRCWPSRFRRRRFGLGLDLTARASLRKLVLWHAFPMLMRVHRSSSGHTTLIIVETGDPLSTNAVCYAGSGEGHDQYKGFHGQRQKFLNRVGDSSL